MKTNQFILLWLITSQGCAFAARTVYFSWYPKGGPPPNAWTATNSLILTISNPSTVDQNVTVSTNISSDCCVTERWSTLTSCNGVSCTCGATCTGPTSCSTSVGKTLISANTSKNYGFYSAWSTGVTTNVPTVKISVQEDDGFLIAHAEDYGAGSSNIGVTSHTINGGKPF